MLCLLQVFYVFMLCGNILSRSLGTCTGEGAWQKTVREDAVARSGFQRPCFLLRSTGKGHRGFCSPNSPSMDSVSLVKSLNLSRLSPMQNEQSYAHVWAELCTCLWNWCLMISLGILFERYKLQKGRWTTESLVEWLRDRTLELNPRYCQWR